MFDEVGNVGLCELVDAPILLQTNLPSGSFHKLLPRNSSAVRLR